MVPHIIFHERHDTYFPGPDVWRLKQEVPTSGITQPPVAASVARFIYERAKDREMARDMLARLLPRIFLYHHWYHHQRDPGKTGLVAIYHPWESGRDNSPEWDAALAAVPADKVMPYKRRDIDHVLAEHRPSQDDYNRYMALVELFRSHDYDHGAIYPLTPFRMADAGVNFMLMRANRDLLWLLEETGSADGAARAEIAKWIARQEEAFESLWDENAGAYCSLDLVAGRNTGIATSGSFLSLYAGAARGGRAERVAGTVERWISESKFSVPTIVPSDVLFDRMRYWRGPIWAIMNFMVATGLRESGYYAALQRIGEDTAVLIRTNGFREYFDSLSGAGLGGADFSWTAAMWLFWAREFGR